MLLAAKSPSWPSHPMEDELLDLLGQGSPTFFPPIGIGLKDFTVSCRYRQLTMPLRLALTCGSLRGSSLMKAFSSYYIKPTSDRESKLCFTGSTCYFFFLWYWERLHSSVGSPNFFGHCKKWSSSTSTKLAAHTTGLN